MSAEHIRNAKRYEIFDESHDQASFLEGNFKWKAISIVTKLTQNDVLLIQEWMKSNVATAAFRDKKFGGFCMPKIVSGFNNLGAINYSNSSLHPEIPNLGVKSNYAQSCLLSLVKLGPNSYYLSAYYKLQEEATKHIRQIDTSHMRGYKVLLSFNPFFKHFGAYSSVHQEKVIDRELNRRVDTVCKDVINTYSKTLSFMGIYKSEKHSVLVADFFRYDKRPYLVDRELPEDNDEKQGYSLLPRRRYKHLDQKISTNSTENFIVHELTENNCLDAIYILSEDPDLSDEYSKCEHSSLEITSSYVFTSILLERSKEFYKNHEEINISLANDSKKTDLKFGLNFKQS
ncbi:hypothetical protein L1D50_23030, partial [Pseudoalteromonas sp. Isolate6]|uniref:hypothetical protein n=1 Tax=Pseudoalteromonas sp. Isolate6 TaxID=2908527 RepID=UPI001EFE233F